MTDRENQRLLVAHQWAEEHAERSSAPSRFLENYERYVSAVRHGKLRPEESLISYADPVRLAGEIEALAAWRRVQT
jgi:hypothetical protein